MIGVCLQTSMYLTAVQHHKIKQTDHKRTERHIDPQTQTGPRHLIPRLQDQETRGCRQPTTQHHSRAYIAYSLS
jgi:hypothetical protein